jgi:putative membrane protein
MKHLKKFALAIVLNALALYVLTMALTDIGYTGGVEFFVVAGIIIGLINSIVKPVLKLVTLPLIFVTGGLFLIAINAFSLWFLSYFLEIAQFHELSITFPNIGSYVIGSVLFGIINWVEHLLIKNN